MEFKRVLVTGGAGFIGSHLVDRLAEEGYEVFIIDNLLRGKTYNIEHHFKNPKVWFDRRGVESSGMHNIFRMFQPEIVFHLAAIPGVPFSMEHPVESNESNVQGTVNLLELSRRHKVKRLIFSSSSSVYGGSKILPTPEDTVLNPQSPYALQKKIGEEYCELFSRSYDLDTVSLRYFNVFGPRQRGDSPYASVIAAFSEAIKNKTGSKIYGDGEVSRDFCYVDNIVNANMLAARCDESFNGDIFNVGCGGNTTINKLHKIMKAPKAEYFDERAGDIKHSQADISKIKRVLGYTADVSFKDGIKKTLDWYLDGQT